MNVVLIQGIGRFRLHVVILFVGGILLSGSSTVRGEALAVRSGDGSRLVYEHDARGNRVPDFSHCGYAGANRAIPHMPVRVTVAPAAGDDGSRIQAAIDYVARLPRDEDGFRGAVWLAPGRFEIAGQLRITASGIVLRGAGTGENGTTLVATGQDRRALVRIAGVDDRRLRNTRRLEVSDEYVPVGADKLRLNSTDYLRVGDAVVITRPSTTEWIARLGMNAFGVAWKPGTRDIRWDRIVTGIDGNTVSFDAPITTAIEMEFGGATVEPYDWPGRIEHVGVEDLRLQSAYANDNSRGEEHAWFGVTMENVQNAWVRRVEFRHFAGGAVALWESTKWVSVEDCVSLEPMSELAGYRRHTFFTQGQLSLFLRCWSEQGRHDFSVGHCAAGPNAFVNCYAAHALGTSGPIESWAAGVLYDNVRIEGAGLHLENRWTTPPGAGWSAANCLLWQCQAATVRSFRPPSANNWAIGCWAEFVGDATFQAHSDFVRPISLYQAQLRERTGADAAAHVEPGLVDPIGSTSPTIEEAAEFVAQSNRPARQLIDVIREQLGRVHRDKRDGEAKTVEQILSGAAESASSVPTHKPLVLQNGWLVVDGQLKTGGHLDQSFWRGAIRPDEAPTFGPALTRFVPGRVGRGYTDDLEQLADKMLVDGKVVFDHHYGLWYDRRRDDHLMVRREDGDVAPPFLEQPFARTGVGTAWDGLSKYDLTRFNPWYWRRLSEFAGLCDEHGLVLIHQHYFQHNILEAGAHWADSPWRPANNVNDTGLPEPPPYIGDKRIFLAHLFYDVTHPRRREFHRGYIRQCLNNFADSSNVIHMTSAEYTGPLEFTQFWIDTIVEWQQEQEGRNVLIGLSCTKDVQDAILADPKRGPHVDVIDIRYWTYMADGELYAPEGGKSLAPRQHLRQLQPGPTSFASIVQAVREMRARYPEKAVTYYADRYCRSDRDGWAVLMGGGSLPDVKLPAELTSVIPTLRPADGIVSGEGEWCLAEETGDYLIYTERIGESIEVHLPNEPARYRVKWINTKSGEFRSGGQKAGNELLGLKAEANVLWLSRI